MRVNEDYRTWNVSSELQDPSSVLLFYTRALSIRKAHPIFVRRIPVTCACDIITMVIRRMGNSGTFQTAIHKSSPISELLVTLELSSSLISKRHLCHSELKMQVIWMSMNSSEETMTTQGQIRHQKT